MTRERVSASVFADSLGVQRSNISHIVSGRNKPSLEFIQKIASSYPKYSIEWLVLGIGNPTVTQTNEQLTSPKETKRENALFKNVTSAHNEKLQAEHITTQANQNTSQGVVEPIIKEPTIKDKPEKAIKEIIICYTDQTFISYKPHE